ncbi:MAG: hypothetical protein JXR68_01560 [Bacteroidales bacterium]|nr:hypothetical protein [Bacteroidales bacterium]
MKRITIIAILIAFLGLNFGYAAETVKMSQKSATEQIQVKKEANFFNKIKTKASQKIQKIKKTYDILKDKLNQQTQSLRTAIILMAIGLIMIILAPAVGGGIVYAVGAIFFIIGAVFLLLELL